MTVKGRFSLDTNILVYAVDRDAGERHVRSRELLGRAARRDCVLTVQALAEFYHATTRKSLLAPGPASAFVRDWLDVFPVTSVDGAALVDAMDAVEEHRLSFWDALLWATARQAGCAAILSEDMQDGRRLSGVVFINPFAADASARLEALLEP
jgi:predicted nucleic acid-binding protein